jgi:hypothetical protein
LATKAAGHGGSDDAASGHDPSNDVNKADHGDCAVAATDVAGVGDDDVAEFDVDVQVGLFVDARSVVEHGLEVSALSGGEKSLTSLVLLSAIARVYGDHADDILALLKKHPSLSLVGPKVV